MKFKVMKFKTVYSTNDTAINLIKNKRKKVGCVCAKKQTNGRGTHGKKWISKVGNLFLSIFFPLKKKYPPFSEFSIINPVIMSKVIKKFCHNKTVSLKWPNDVLVNGKKICGILQEVVISKNIKYLIIGIGINTKLSPKIKNKYKATSIYFETGHKPTNIKITNLITSQYEKFFKNLNSYNFLKFKIKADSMAENK